MSAGSARHAWPQNRTLSATVDRYLSSVNTPKRRGRKVPKAALQRRLADARTRFDTAIGVEKVLAAQEIRDLQARIAAIDAAGGEDHAALEAQFVKIAKQFGFDDEESAKAQNVVKQDGVSDPGLQRS